MVSKFSILGFCTLILLASYGQEITYYTKLNAKQPTFVKTGEALKFVADQPKLYIYRFDHIFLVPPAPFIESSKSQKRTVHSDSLFIVKTGEYVEFSKARLYFAQKDTTSLTGLSFRVVSPSFPKFEKVSEVIESLSYIMTASEQDLFAKSSNKKQTLDDFLRQITRNDLRKAQVFMQNYFKRVSEANQNYTNFKPGWKTDKGMIYIIFGSPKIIRTEEEGEVWSYENNLEFEFIKKKTIFSDEHYILTRRAKYRYVWQNQQLRLRNNQF